MYIDGSQVAFMAQTGTLTADTGPLFIGSDDSYPGKFAGTIDSVRIYHCALSSTAIQALATASSDGSSVVANPPVSPAAGTYRSAQSVTISTPTSGATLQYMTDGTPPGSTVGTVYSSPVTINSSCTLKAMAYKSGYQDFHVASAVYTIGSTLTNFFKMLYTGTRNDFTGTVGYEFVPASDITIQALGRAVSTSMAHNHQVRIWRVPNQSVVADVTVTPSSPTDSLGYKYAMLAAPVTLTGGVAYRIASSETAGGDMWMTSMSIGNHRNIAAVTCAVYGNGNFYPPDTGGAAENGSVPPTFYTVAGGTWPAPHRPRTISPITSC